MSDAGNALMARIMIMCPTIRKPVPTGLRTDMVIFESLPDVAMPVSCQECDAQHLWRPRDAWVNLADGQHVAGISLRASISLLQSN